MSCFKSLTTALFALASNPCQCHTLNGADPATPAPLDWEFGLKGSFATGLALVDLNQDGYKDIIVSNGNDMFPQPIAVHFYQPNPKDPENASFQDDPGWLSDDYDYHMGLCVGDVNQDGHEDLAVTMPWDRLQDRDRGGGVKLYLGTGSGLAPLPKQRILGD